MDWGDRTNEQDVRVASDTADIETGQLLIIRHSMCPVAFSNYKCFNIGLFHNSTVFLHSYVINRNEFLHDDGVRFLHPAA